MKLHVTNDTAEWYKSEFDLQTPARLRYYVRYGFGGHIPGFSLGVRVDTPNEMYTSYQVDDLTFFIEAKDAWYFEEKDLFVKLNKAKNEPEFSYE
ncbi:hypothetical protein GCM10011409_05650 [Lentibacillus populi]|uniref:FeS cluster biogenesis domain-containing protein n=1 Tax=Lentibacillus populi TaxID=1827502 RepID=A0A9W5TUR6_9BACI|nr:hypothetical protein [Lentibacillus populi]MBT2215000.1 hypothetical protein [Virgibacillus dakarensis]GGB31147.1 hypothetical protein GCM10011409_05650 [Lentibacillus populi]